MSLPDPSTGSRVAAGNPVLYSPVQPRSMTAENTEHLASDRQLASVPAGVGPNEVITWMKAGARDDVIIDRIERSDNVYRLTAGDEMLLRQQGVSDDVICALKEALRR